MRINSIFQFPEQKQAENFAAAVKNRFGLAAFTYDGRKAHVLGEVYDEIERQVYAALAGDDEIERQV
jgi:hypothetical protein